MLNMSIRGVSVMQATSAKAVLGSPVFALDAQGREEPRREVKFAPVALPNLAWTPEVARETFELAMNTVDSLTVGPRSVVTYNLGVRGTHAYFAGGVLVHDGP